MTPELSRVLAVDRVGRGGLDFVVTATEAECAALARRMAIPAVRALVCRFELTAHPGGVVAASGHLQAEVVQSGVVTLEDVPGTVDERFSVSFVPEAELSDAIDPESDDEVGYTGGVMDLGEAASEQLALSLDPFPRAPDAMLPEAARDDAAHPFAGLAQWKRKT